MSAANSNLSSPVYKRPGALAALADMASKFVEKELDYLRSKHSALVDRAAMAMDEPDRRISEKQVNAVLMGAGAIAAVAATPIGVPISVSAALAAGAYILGSSARSDKEHQGAVVNGDGLNASAARASVNAFYRDQSASPFPVGEYVRGLQAKQHEVVKELLIAYSELKDMENAAFDKSALKQLGSDMNIKLQSMLLERRAEKNGVHITRDGDPIVSSVETLIKIDLNANSKLWDRALRTTPAAVRDAQVREILGAVVAEREAFRGGNGDRPAADVVDVVDIEPAALTYKDLETFEQVAGAHEATVIRDMPERARG